MSLNVKSVNTSNLGVNPATDTQSIHGTPETNEKTGIANSSTTIASSASIPNPIVRFITAIKDQVVTWVGTVRAYIILKRLGHDENQLGEAIKGADLTLLKGFVKLFKDEWDKLTPPVQDSWKKVMPNLQKQFLQNLFQNTNYVEACQSILKNSTLDNTFKIACAIMDCGSTVNCLLEAGYKFANDEEAKTTLASAIEKGWHTTVESMVKLNPKLNSALHDHMKAALEKNRKSTVNCLLQAGYKFANDEEARTTLASAIEKGWFCAALLIGTHSDNLMKVLHDHMKTALDNNCESTVNCLLSVGYMKFVVDTQAQTIFKSAIEKGWHTTVDLLLFLGLDIHESYFELAQKLADKVASDKIVFSLKNTNKPRSSNAKPGLLKQMVDGNGFVKM